MLKRKCLGVIVLILAAATMLVGKAVSAEIVRSDPSLPKLGDEIIISDLDMNEYVPSVAYNWKHNEYLVVWIVNPGGSNPTDIRGARISSTGKILEEFVTIDGMPNDVTMPAAAYDPVHDRFLVVFLYDDTGYTGWDVYGRFIPWDGPVSSLSSFPIDNNPADQMDPRVVYAESEKVFIVAWYNIQAGSILSLPASQVVSDGEFLAVQDNVGIADRSSGDYVTIRRLNASDGNLLEAIAYNTSSLGRRNIDIAYNLARNEVLAVFDDGNNIDGAKCSAGDLYTCENMSIAVWPDKEYWPRVAACSGADQYFVTWTSDQAHADSPTDAIYGRFISGSGDLGSVHKIADSPGDDEANAEVTCNHAGTEYLAVWHAVNYPKFEVKGRLIQTDGTLEPEISIAEPQDGLFRGIVSAAGGQTSYLTSWIHGRSSYEDIHGRLIFYPQNIFIPLIRH